MEQHIQSLCALFSPSLSILSTVQFKSSRIFLFSFPSFYFAYNLKQTQMKQKKHSFSVTISRSEKDGAQSIISCMVYLIMVDSSFSQITDDFVLVSAKLSCQILLPGISDATSMVIYHVAIIEKNFFNSISRFAL